MAEAGKQIKESRKRRGLTQSELAKASSVSVSLIRQLEQGTRATTTMETLRKLAIALRVPTMHLSGSHREEGPTPGTEDRWAGVRRAVEGPEMSSDIDDEPTVAGVRATLDAAMPLFRGDKLAELAVILPPMLREADALGAEGRAVRARLLQLSGWLMVQTRQFDAAKTALSRAMDDATDRMDGAGTASVLCWLLLRQGRLDEALRLAVEWADDMEPRMSRATPEELSTWGWLLLRASAAAIRNGQPGQATDTLRLAQSAAVAIGREHTPGDDFLRTFGLPRSN